MQYSNTDYRYTKLNAPHAKGETDFNLQQI